MNVSPAMATSGKVSSRLLNSIHVFNVVWPTDCAATTLALGTRRPVRAAEA